MRRTILFAALAVLGLTLAPTLEARAGEVSDPRGDLKGDVFNLKYLHSERQSIDGRVQYVFTVMMWERWGLGDLKAGYVHEIRIELDTRGDTRLEYSLRFRAQGGELLADPYLKNRRTPITTLTATKLRRSLTIVVHPRLLEPDKPTMWRVCAGHWGMEWAPDKG